MKAAGGRTESSSSHATHLTNSDFAIADFDGDRKPDLATVEVQRTGSALNARYSIRFELTDGATQNFGVTAPAGGLQIVARDVNGDSFLDLLVRTAWQHKDVAVLLNDGHGNFTLAEPPAFPGSMWGDDGGLNSESVPRSCRVALAGAQQSADRAEESPLGRASKQTGFAGRAVFHGPTSLRVVSPPGRAPPP